MPHSAFNHSLMGETTHSVTNGLERENDLYNCVKDKEVALKNLQWGHKLLWKDMNLS